MWKHQTLPVTKQPSAEGIILVHIKWVVRLLKLPATRLWVNGLFRQNIIINIMILLTLIVQGLMNIVICRDRWTGVKSSVFEITMLLILIYYCMLLVTFPSIVIKAIVVTENYHLTSNSFIFTNIFLSIKVSWYYGMSFMNDIIFSNKSAPCAIYHTMNLMAYVQEVTNKGVNPENVSNINQVHGVMWLYNGSIVGSADGRIYALVMTNHLA